MILRSLFGWRSQTITLVKVSTKYVKSTFRFRRFSQCNSGIPGEKECNEDH
jgi:hypothetical protein